MHVSNKSCTFAVSKVIKTTFMKDKMQIVNAPIQDSGTSGAVRQQYFTADEAMAILEPRIRSMFK